MCFRDVLLSGFRMVLGMFWETFWCHKDDQKAKGGFVEMFVLLKSYCCFRGLWAPFGVPELKKNRVGCRSGFEHGFMVIFAPFWESLWKHKSMKQVSNFRWIVEGFPGRPKSEGHHQVEGNMIVQWPYNNIETGCRKTES